MFEYICLNATGNDCGKLNSIIFLHYDIQIHIEMTSILIKKMQKKGSSNLFDDIISNKYILYDLNNYKYLFL